MVKIELDRASQARMRRTIERYAELTKQGFEEGVREIGKSSARRLANTVQPFGLSPAKGASLEKSIGRQVDAVYLGVNLGAFPATSSISKAHLAARKNGKVPYRQFRKERGKPWLDLITMGEKESYKRQVVKKAGRAKAAWVTAGNKLGMGDISGIPKWISRHVGNSWGDVSFIGSGVKFTIYLINKTSYIRAIQPDSQIKKAMKEGMINGYKRMAIIIKRKTRAIERAAARDHARSIKAIAKEQKRLQTQYSTFNKRATRLHALKISI